MKASEIVQAYVRAMEAQDRDAVAATLAPDVVHMFPVAGDDQMSGIFQGREEVLGYVDGYIAKFRSLVWVDKRWTESSDGRTVFLEARGDALMAHSGEPYRNLYVERFDVEDGAITRILEYADPAVYLATGTPPSDHEVAVVTATPARVQSMQTSLG